MSPLCGEKENQMELRNKVAIVTGGSGGIGEAIVLALARAGADVVINYNRSVQRAREVVEQVQSMGRRALALRADVCLSSEVSNIVSRVVKEFDKIDILVNNAGVTSLAPVVELEEKDWDRVFDVNVKGVFLCSKAVSKHMINRKEGGKIINISSRVGKIGEKLSAHYSASKFAVIGFTQALALELAPYRINVNAICPGKVETGMQIREWEFKVKSTGVPFDKVRADDISTVPLGRAAKPEEIGNLVVFMCSDLASYMTGQAINITGGREMR